MSAFAVGQRVKIVKVTDYAGTRIQALIGQEAFVDSVSGDSDANFPITVDVSNISPHFNVLLFKSDELEAV